MLVGVYSGSVAACPRAEGGHVMIFDQLSLAARRLYEELSASGPRSATDLDWTGEPDPVVAELVRLGFAALRGEPAHRQLHAVGLQNVLEHRLLRLTGRIQHEEQDAAQLRQQLVALRDRDPLPSSTHDLAEILTDADAIREASAELMWLAERDVLVINTAHFRNGPGPARPNPPQVNEGTAVLRNIYPKAYLEDAELKTYVDLSVAAGNLVRIGATVPMKLVIVDRHRALVPLEPTGLTASLLVKSPHLVGALRELFESVWRRSTDYAPGRNDTRLTAAARAEQEQRRLLNMLVAGLKDDTVAHDLGVSLRTVRRHVARLQDRFRVDNRMALAVEATRADWID